MRRLPNWAGAGAPSQLLRPAENSQSMNPLFPPLCRYRENQSKSIAAVPTAPAAAPRATTPSGVKRARCFILESYDVVERVMELDGWRPGSAASSPQTPSDHPPRSYRPVNNQLTLQRHMLKFEYDLPGWWDMAATRLGRAPTVRRKRARPNGRALRGNEPVLIPMYAEMSRRPPPSRPFLNLLWSLVQLLCAASCERFWTVPCYWQGPF